VCCCCCCCCAENNKFNVCSVVIVSGQIRIVTVSVWPSSRTVNLLLRRPVIPESLHGPTVQMYGRHVVEGLWAYVHGAIVGR
jgi:hypothetical protein